MNQNDIFIRESKQSIIEKVNVILCFKLTDTNTVN